MKEENLIALIKELAKVDTLHQEYEDNNIHYVIDSERDEDGTLNFSVQIKDHTDKKEFEQFVDNLDDDLFQEVWESLSEEDELHNLNEIYESENYQEVIDKFKAKAKEIAREKINDLNKILEA